MGFSKFQGNELDSCNLGHTNDYLTWKCSFVLCKSIKLSLHAAGMKTVLMAKVEMLKVLITSQSTLHIENL